MAGRGQLLRPLTGRRFRSVQMPELLILLQLLRLLIWATATCVGSVGIYALVWSSLHRPAAALTAIIALTLVH